jgi:hypothetical protein
MAMEVKCETRSFDTIRMWGSRDTTSVIASKRFHLGTFANHL